MRQFKSGHRKRRCNYKRQVDAKDFLDGVLVNIASCGHAEILGREEEREDIDADEQPELGSALGRLL